MSDWQPWAPTYTLKFKWWQFRAKRNYRKTLESLKKKDSSQSATPEEGKE